MESIADQMSKLNSEGLGQRFRRLRERRGITLDEVGAAIGRSRQAVHQYETGKTRIPLEIIEPWADVLGLDVDVIMWERGQDLRAIRALSAEQTRAVLEFAGAVDAIPRAQLEAILALCRAHRTSDPTL